MTALQLLPLLPIVITFIGTLPGGWNPTTLAGGIVATAIIQYLVARADVAALGRRGFVEQAPAALALVSSAWYLRLRAQRCEGHDPTAAAAVPWAIGVTIAAVVVGVVATLFVWAITGGLAAINDAG